MKTFKYILFFFFISLFSACMDEELDSLKPGSGDENATAIISISAKDLVPVNMNQTRALPTNGENISQLLSKITDLNIRITMKNKMTNCIYIINDDLPSDYVYLDGNTFTQMSSVKALKFHCNKIKANDVQKVEVIANYGKKITETENWDAIQEKNADPFPKIGDFNSLKDNTCMMYGIATSSTENPHLTGKPACKLFNVTLKRTRALLSVQLVGTKNLKPGVQITPTSVRLCNVPNTCFLTKLGTNEGNKISTISESVESAQLSNVNLGFVETGKSIGGHADQNGAFSTNFYPLVLFENKQGQSTSTATEAAFKYPDGITSVAEANNRNINYKYSYIKIEAQYKYIENSTVKIGGTIVYRFFLGADDLKDFNIEGNHYYKLTLNLSGYGGAKEDGKVENGQLVVNTNDLSWRVDMDTSDWGFQKNEYDFDGHFIDAGINVFGTNWHFVDIVGIDEYASWITMEVIHDGKPEWINPVLIKDANQLNVVNGRVRVQLQPMTYAGYTSLNPAGMFNKNDYKASINFRSATFIIATGTEGQPDYKTQEVVFKQYVPILVQLSKNKNDFVFMERFEEYDSNKDGVVIYGYNWGFDGNNLTNLVDKNNNAYTYKWDDPSKDDIGKNHDVLSRTKPKNRKIAPLVAYDKGLPPVLQGSGVQFYTLPSEQIMKAMISTAANYEPDWGPFEPIHILDDYWTSSVPSGGDHLQTKYYVGGSNNQFKVSDSRQTKKRVRAIYTNTPGY